VGAQIGRSWSAEAVSLRARSYSKHPLLTVMPSRGHQERRVKKQREKTTCLRSQFAVASIVRHGNGSAAACQCRDESRGTLSMRSEAAAGARLCARVVASATTVEPFQTHGCSGVYAAKVGLVAKRHSWQRAGLRSIAAAAMPSCTPVALGQCIDRVTNRWNATPLWNEALPGVHRTQFNFSSNP
jgi:hypothetical protein